MLDPGTLSEMQNIRGKRERASDLNENATRNNTIVLCQSITVSIFKEENRK